MSVCAYGRVWECGVCVQRHPQSGDHDLPLADGEEPPGTTGSRRVSRLPPPPATEKTRVKTGCSSWIDPSVSKTHGILLTLPDESRQRVVLPYLGPVDLESQVSSVPFLVLTSYSLLIEYRVVGVFLLPSFRVLRILVDL